MQGPNDQGQIVSLEFPRMGTNDPVAQLVLKNDVRLRRVTLTVGYERKVVRAAVCSLIQFSPYFSKLLPMEDKVNETTIDLAFLNPDAVEALIRLMYTGKLDVSNQNVGNLIIASDHFKMLAVKNRCIGAQVELLNPENCLKVRDFATRNGVNDLLAKTDTFISNNFPGIASTENFLWLSEVDLKTMITNCSKEVTSDLVIFQAIARWANKDVTKAIRVPSLFDLLQLINLEQLHDSSEEAANELAKEFRDGIFNHCPRCFQFYFDMVVDKAAKNRTMHPNNNGNGISSPSPTLTNTTTAEEEQKAGPSRRFIKLSPSPLPDYNDDDDGQGQGHLDSSDSSPSPSLKRSKIQPPKLRFKSPQGPNPKYSRTESNWKSEQGWLSLSDSTSSSEDEREADRKSSISMKSDIIFAVFQRKEKFLRTYNFMTKTTVRVEHMAKIPRKLSTLAYYDGKIFDLGGSTELSKADQKCEETNYVEVFLPGVQYGQAALKMKSSRRHAASCICNDYLYVFGGCQLIDGVDTTFSFGERLNLKEDEEVKNRWHKIPDMKFCRDSHAVAVLDDKIFVIGGFGWEVGSKTHKLSAQTSSVECFDPDEDTWEFMRPMLEPRAFHKVVVVNGKIYAVGGSKSKEWTPMNSVEVFSPNLGRGTWTACAPMNKDRMKGMVLADGKLIYAIGGDCKTNPTMEVYDTTKNEWKMMPWPKALSKNADFNSAIPVSM